ncbi:PepSY domain-containing protein [Actinomadura rifamycini]|uniref:PepSY domain-containing protein n=1 Tax=Actinomadura rifamycini TaxID=31962 RepID=UPI00040E40CA|nr:PepSY domain-containing protein [Actinomadura rifamycini]
MRGPAAAPAALLAATLALGACGGDGPDAPGASGTAETLTAPGTTPLPVTTPAGGALDRAAATALKAAPGTVLTSVEREGDGWEVRLVAPDGAERELTVDGAGTEVVRDEPEPEDRADREENLRRVRRAKLDYRDAADAMRATVPGARVTELELDERRGALVWEGDAVGPDGARRTVEVDARTGRVLRR